MKSTQRSGGKSTQESRGFSFQKCDNCGNRTLFPIRSENRVFCSHTCQDFFQAPKGFCQKCLEETEDAPAPSTFQMNGMGHHLMGATDICPTCNSRIQTRFITIAWLPLFPIDKYRIIQISPGKYIGRQLRGSLIGARGDASRNLYAIGKWLGVYVSRHPKLVLAIFIAALCIIGWLLYRETSFAIEADLDQCTYSSYKDVGAGGNQVRLNTLVVLCMKSRGLKYDKYVDNNADVFSPKSYHR